jgi:hypothetical protein
VKTILHWALWLLIVSAVIGIVRKAYADPFISAEQDGVRIVVYTEPCTLNEVKNLPQRATWTQDGKTIEGCAGYLKELEMVTFYFADRTVFPVPAALFQKVFGS